MNYNEKKTYSSICLGIMSLLLLIVYIVNHLINPNFLKGSKFTDVATPIILVIFIILSICHSNNIIYCEKNEEESLLNV